MTTDLQQQVDILASGCAELISREDLLARLHSKKTLRVKAGFDPTASDLHLGHTVVFNKLRQFQSFGHTVIFLIGDFTGAV